MAAVGGAPVPTGLALRHTLDKINCDELFKGVQTGADFLAFNRENIMNPTPDNPADHELYAKIYIAGLICDRYEQEWPEITDQWVDWKTTRGEWSYDSRWARGIFNQMLAPLLKECKITVEELAASRIAHLKTRQMDKTRLLPPRQGRQEGDSPPRRNP